MVKMFLFRAIQFSQSVLIFKKSVQQFSSQFSSTEIHLIQIINSISNNLVQHEYTVQSSKAFLFQAIQIIQTVLIQPI